MKPLKRAAEIWTEIRPIKPPQYRPLKAIKHDMKSDEWKIALNHHQHRLKKIEENVERVKQHWSRSKKSSKKSVVTSKTVSLRSKSAANSSFLSNKSYIDKWIASKFEALITEIYKLKGP